MNLTNSRRGQVVIAVGIALFAMFGLLGLTFDIGWSFYLEKTSQTAADAAAMAAALEVLEVGGNLGPYDCTLAEVFCSTSPVACAANPTIGADPNSSLEAGCVYARRNGFWLGNPDLDQNVRMAADAAAVGATITPPTAPGVNAFYWTTALVAQEPPQLLSAMLGNTSGIVSSAATAAIVDSVVTGSLFLLNREDDGDFGFGEGTDLFVNSNANPDYSLRAAGRVLSSSAADGSGVYDYSVDINNGNAFVETKGVFMRGAGDYDMPGNHAWQDHFNVKPKQQPANSKLFLDPTAPRPNPPLAPNGQLAQPIAGGTVSTGVSGDGTEADPYILPEGVYYGYTIIADDPVVTGDPIRLSGPNTYWRLCGNGGNCGAGFGEYTFVGGLDIGNTNVEFGPGRYVYAGTSPGGGGQQRYNLNIDTNAFVTDTLDPGQAAPSGNAGQLHILAGPDYVGGAGADQRSITNFVNSTVAATADLSNVIPNRRVEYAPSRFHLGATESGLIRLHGLQPLLGTGDSLPPELEPYRRFTIWQDRRNSTFDYNYDGTYPCQTNGSGIAGSCEYDNPEGSGNPADTELVVQASPQISLYGVIYQPRGSFVTMAGGGGYAGPIQIVTGAFNLQGTAEVDLGLLDNPIITRLVALVH